MCAPIAASRDESRRSSRCMKNSGKAPQSRHLGAPIAFLTTETGNPNEYVHIWMYEDAGDRERRRAAMQADPDWQAFLAASAELGALEYQENKLMKPVDFLPGSRPRLKAPSGRCPAGSTRHRQAGRRPRGHHPRGAFMPV